MKKVFRARVRTTRKQSRKLVVDLDARPEVRDSLDRAVRLTKRTQSSIVEECLEIGLRVLAPVTERSVREQLAETALEMGLSEDQVLSRALIHFAAAIGKDGKQRLISHDGLGADGKGLKK